MNVTVSETLDSVLHASYHGSELIGALNDLVVRGRSIRADNQRFVVDSDRWYRVVEQTSVQHNETAIDHVHLDHVHRHLLQSANDK